MNPEENENFEVKLEYIQIVSLTSNFLIHSQIQKKFHQRKYVSFKFGLESQCKVKLFNPSFSPWLLRIKLWKIFGKTRTFEFIRKAVVNDYQNNLIENQKQASTDQRQFLSQIGEDYTDLTSANNAYSLHRSQANLQRAPT